ncbi:MAG: hypothetical protein KF696_04125 [Planctomycetes bacterium]|nr:hypothetical protein [Planctomycetota bacterium]MCW8134159.1 hypothetical protein [Planctomycetota bacterium]
MTFFEIAHWILMGGVILAGLAATGVVISTLRERPAPAKAPGDCREDTLILHGEGARRDC